MGFSFLSLEGVHVALQLLLNIDVNAIRENAICNIYIKDYTGFTWNLFFSIFGKKKNKKKISNAEGICNL